MAKHKNHHMVVWRFGLTLCVLCGLLGLKNDVSSRALRASCPGKED